MITISVNLGQIERRLQAIANEQVPFATALALTNTAKDVAAGLAAEMPRHLDRPTPFTLRAWAFERAEKQRAIARVYARPAQAKYLKWQIEGGDRAPNRKLQRLPGEITLNAYGNLPAGEIARLIALAKAGRRVTKARGKKIGVSNKVDLFYGDPGDGRPVGIYKRVIQSGRHLLIPLVVMPQRSVRYRPRFPAKEIVRKTADRVFPGHFQTALKRAMATAR